MPEKGRYEKPSRPSAKRTSAERDRSQSTWNLIISQSTGVGLDLFAAEGLKSVDVNSSYRRGTTFFEPEIWLRNLFVGTG